MLREVADEVADDAPPGSPAHSKYAWNGGFSTGQDPTCRIWPICRYPGLDVRGIERLISEILDSIGRSLGSGKRAELRGFGGFQVKVRGPRPSRNPETSETIIVAEKKTLQIRGARDC
jgi:nucleoid DNA-binding protein